MPKQTQCPVCGTQLDNPILDFCPVCNWECGVDISLIPSLSKPTDRDLEYYQRKLALAKQHWNKIQEQLQGQTKIMEYKDKELAAIPATATVDGTPVHSLMPGMFIRYEKKVGDKVWVGETVLVLEAREMYNHIPSPVQGIVVATPFTAGNSVGKGDTLIVIKPECSIWPHQSIPAGIPANSLWETVMQTKRIIWIKPRWSAASTAWRLI